MDPTVAIALITGGATGITGITAATLSYFAARRQAEGTIAALERQSESEARRLEAENQRLRDQFGEAERQHRQGNYHRWLTAVDRLDTVVVSDLGSRDELESFGLELATLYAGMALFGDQAVVDALHVVSEMISEVGAGLGDLPPETAWLEYRKSYFQRREEIIGAERVVIDAMRRDVARHLDAP